MPDWMTHIGVAWILCKLLRIKRRDTTIVLIGSLIPDLSKIAVPIIYLMRWYSVRMLTRPLHTPIGSFLTAIAITSLFIKESWKKTICLLTFAIGIHLMLDSFMWPWPQMDGGILLFWPLSWKPYSFGLIWPDDPRPLMVTVILVTLMYAYERIHKES